MTIKRVKGNITVEVTFNPDTTSPLELASVLLMFAQEFVETLRKVAERPYSGDDEEGGHA